MKIFRPNSSSLVGPLHIQWFAFFILAVLNAIYLLSLCHHLSHAWYLMLLITPLYTLRIIYKFIVMYALGLDRYSTCSGYLPRYGRTANHRHDFIFNVATELR